MKKFRLLLTVLLLLIVLSACGKDDIGVTGEDLEESDEITIQFLRPGPPEIINPIFDPLIEEFMEENPGIKVETMNLGFADTEAKYPVMASSGTLPDVIYSTMDRGFGLAANNMLVPLDEYLADGNIKEEIPQSLWDGIEFQGHHYWIPSGVGSIVLWYNTELFEQAGLDPNNPPQTLEEMLEAAKTITEKTGVPGIGIPGKISVDHLSTMFQSIYSSISGEPLWDSTQENLTISLEENKKYGIEALQYLYELVNVHEVTQSNIVEFDRNDLRPIMRDGKVAMVLDGIWIRGVIQEQIKEGKILPAKFPAGSAGSHALIGVDGWSITSNSEHPEAAWKLIEFLMKTENQARHGIEYGLNPVLESEYELEEFNTEFWEPIIEGQQEGYSRIAHENIVPLETAISEGVQAAMLGDLSPEDAIELILKETEQYLEQ